MMTPDGSHFRPLNPKDESPVLKAVAQAAREARQKGQTPVFFSHPKGSQQNPDGETNVGPTSRF
jgi:hypothetical protein